MSKTQPFFYFFLSWLIPGFGHLLQKRILKAAVFFVGISSLLILGLFMKGGITPLYDLQPLTLLSFVGSCGNGIFYFIIKLAGLGAGNIRAFTFHYGSAYIVIAGFLNYLIAFNAYETARGKTDV